MIWAVLGHLWERLKAYKILNGQPNGRNYLENLDLDKTIISKWILKKEG